MVDSVQISALSAASTLDGAELFPVVQGGATKKATVDRVRFIYAGSLVGDGTTDNTTAFQAAVDAAVAANAVLVLPLGTFVTGPLTVGAAGSYNSCTIRGDSFSGHYTNTGNIGTVIKLKDSSNATLFTVAAADASDVGPGPVGFENVWLRGNRSNQTGTSYAVDFSNHTATANKARSGFFNRVRITEFRTSGVRVGTLRNAGYMEQVVILDVGNGSTGSALQLGSCADWRFFGCDFGSTLGPVVQDSGASIINYVGCNFFSGGTHGYKADTAAGDHYFTGCSFDRNARDGVNIATTTPYHWVFAGCRFTINSQETTNTYADVNITDNPNVSFVGCSFASGGVSNFPQYTLRLTGATTKGISLIGCTIDDDAYLTGLTQDVTNLMIQGEGTFRSFRVIYDPLDVNQVRIEGGQTGQGPAIIAAGSDTNIPMDFRSKGTGSLRFYSDNGSVLQFVVSRTASAVNYLQATGSNSTTPTLSAQGSGTDVDMVFTPKGAGNVRFGTHTGNADAAVTGYITVKDSGGTVRKLAVIT